jgi:hypothetical protein
MEKTTKRVKVDEQKELEIVKEVIQDTEKIHKTAVANPEGRALFEDIY